jgi:Inositol 1,4,5-trisphosphate/ryanodine receptor
MYLHYDAQIMLTFSLQNKQFVLQSHFCKGTLEFSNKAKFNHDANECLFRILPLVSNKVRQNVEALSQQLKQDYSEQAQKNLETQLTKLDRENKTRFLELQKLRGKFISFHTPIQLQHVVSHKFLSISQQTGMHEKLIFELDDNPSERSVVKLLPSFKYQTENQKYVRFDQEIYISMPYKENQYFMSFGIDTDPLRMGFLEEKEAGNIVRGNRKLKSKLE